MANRDQTSGIPFGTGAPPLLLPDVYYITITIIFFPTLLWSILSIIPIIYSIYSYTYTHAAGTANTSV